MTASAAAVPDPAPVLDLLTAFRSSAVMFAACSLGVFDRLAAGGPMMAGVLAGILGADRDALGRLLDACVGLGLLTRDGDAYANSPAAQTYLTQASPRRMTGYVTYSDRVLWQMWAHLADAVREGSNRWQQTFGLDGGAIFANLFRTPEDRREFLQGMHGFGLISSPHVAAAFDLSGFSHLVDLGGATGHLAVAACRQFPNLRATVFDLPAVMPQAREAIAAEPDVAARVGVLAGDFFADPLPPADLYAVGRILHDWAEEKIERLLASVHAALPVGGALLIAEKLLAPDRGGPRWAQLQSLNMLVGAEGKERTLAEYEGLLRRAGFAAVEGRVTDSPLDAILARK
jgi:acetylserotonin N-methyltransferase